MIFHVVESRDTQSYYNIGLDSFKRHSLILGTLIILMDDNLIHILQLDKTYKKFRKQWHFDKCHVNFTRTAFSLNTFVV